MFIGEPVGVLEVAMGVWRCGRIEVTQLWYTTHAQRVI